MKLIKRLNHTTEKNGVITALDILIYEKSIVWYMSEQTKYDDGDEMTDDQSYEDYIKNGPPSFASNLPADIIEEISKTLNDKKLR